LTVDEKRVHTCAAQSRNSNQNRAAFWQIFSSNKSVPANRKTGFYANRDPTSRRLDSFIHKEAQNFKVFLNIQE
jgi:hypothetical protein